MRVLLFAIILASITIAHGQGKFWNSPQAYLGQQPPGDTPQIFALKLLTQKDTFSFDRVAFSDDGMEFYYPTNTTWFDGKNSKIRYFKFEQDSWKGPFILNEHYYAPTFSIDGRSLYLEGGQPDSLHAHIWRSDRTTNGGWTEPALFLQTDFGLYDLMPTNSGTFYIGSNGRQGSRRNYSTYDFCTLNISTNDTIVKSLGSPVNTPGFDGDFFVARDESYMIVSAKEKKDFECELWITFRRPDRTWTAPVSLGPLINNRDAHRWGEYVTPDGKYLFYSTGTSPADCHVYWVRFDLLLAKLKKASL
jgi:hypothetical protein